MTEPAALAIEALRTERVRSVLAIAGIVIGIVTVVLVASILANARNQVALLFRDLGTDNVFAFHLTGDPYVTPSENEANRRPLKLEFVREIRRMGTAVRDVGAQVIVPTAADGQVLVARAGGNESDTVLVEGVTASLFDIIGADFARGRPFTDFEDREGARVAVVGANLARALFGASSPIGSTLTLAGDTYTVVGELAPRRGGFMGENRQDNVLNLPAGTVRRRYGEPERVVIYVQAKPGMRRRPACARAEVMLRLLRKLPPDADNDFTLSTADQIIATFDSLSARIGLVSVGLAAVSLLIGAIGIANVMFISVTERTREIGLRLAVGARAARVRVQFLLEAAFLAAMGGVGGVAAAWLRTAADPRDHGLFSAVPPLWACRGGWRCPGVGLAAGYWPAQRAAALDPVEALPVMSDTSWRLRAAKAVQKVGV